ncbi:MAG: DNA replication and repair protein RecF [Candidatus Dependentiae bacterium]|jgi:DNA replication and repair protein RecF
MILHKLTLKNFRCFEQVALSLGSGSRLVIEGRNGSGKSSIIESLHYCCYLRSFRGGSTTALMRSGGDKSFFIKLEGAHDDGEPFVIQVGYGEGKKLVKVNDKVVHTYKAVMDHYRVVSVAAHDLSLIQEGPDFRRTFLNNYCLLRDPACADLLRAHKQIVTQRNELLVCGGGGSSNMEIWTQQLWEKAEEITALREEALAALSDKVNNLYAQMDSGTAPISLRYVRRKRTAGQSFADFWSGYQNSIGQERHMKRSLFGAHLDDVAIELGGKSARTYASRGQQKLILVLLKLAQVQVLAELQPQSGVLLLLDDVVTDFDRFILDKILALLDTLPCGVVLTSPVAGMVTLPQGAATISL